MLTVAVGSFWIVSVTCLGLLYGEIAQKNRAHASGPGVDYLTIRSRLIYPIVPPACRIIAATASFALSAFSLISG